MREQAFEDALVPFRRIPSPTASDLSATSVSRAIPGRFRMLASQQNTVVAGGHTGTEATNDGEGTEKPNDGNGDDPINPVCPTSKPPLPLSLTGRLLPSSAVRRSAKPRAHLLAEQLEEPHVYNVAMLCTMYRN